MRTSTDEQTPNVPPAGATDALPPVEVFDLDAVIRKTEGLPPVARAHALAIDAILGVLRANPPMVWREEDDHAR